MEGSHRFSPETFLGKYEIAIRGEINTALDSARHNILQIEKQFLPKIFKLESKPEKATVSYLLTCESEHRCNTVSTLLYNDALWRLNAAYLMMCIALFSIAYSNLRTALESLISGFIIARSDEQAQLFLKNDKDFKVNLRLAESLIPSGYNEKIKILKSIYSSLGVHSRFESVQLTNLFGANRFLKYLNETTQVKKPIELPEPQWLVEAGKQCVDALGTVTLLFFWLESLPVDSA